MWGPEQRSLLPDSYHDEDEFRLDIVYQSSQPEAEEEQAESGRAPRARYAYAQSAVKGRPGAAARDSPPASPPCPAAPPARLPPAQWQALAAATRAEAEPAVQQVPGSQLPLTFAEEVHTLLQGLTQQQKQQQQQQLQQWKEQVPQHLPLLQLPGALGAKSPAALPAPAAAGPAARSSGRRWRPPPPPQQQAMSPAWAAAPAACDPHQQQHRPMAAELEPQQGAAGSGGDAFFGVDPDLLQASVMMQQPPRRPPPQRRAPAAAPARQQPRGGRLEDCFGSSQQEALTPLPTRGGNPLAALLGPGPSAARTAATTGRLQQRQRLYGDAAAEGSPVGGSGSRERGRAHPQTSPRKQQTRFAIRAPSTQASHQQQQQQQQHAQLAPPATTAPGVRQLLTSSEPPSTGKQQWQPRVLRPPAAPEAIEVEEEPAGASVRQQLQWWQQTEEQGGAAASEEATWERVAVEPDGAGAAFRTPGPAPAMPMPSNLHHQQQRQHHQQQQQAAAGATTPGSGEEGGGTPGGATPGGGGGAAGQASRQRQFIAQLRPVARPAAIQAQRQRLAGAAGLHARLQAVLAAEKAHAAMQAGGGGGGEGPRLTVLQKELEPNITKCLCRCDAAAAAELGSPEVVALLQSRTARDVDTEPGCTLLLRQPWKVMQLAGWEQPAVLCYSAMQG